MKKIFILTVAIFISSLSVTYVAAAMDAESKKVITNALPGVYSTLAGLPSCEHKLHRLRMSWAAGKSKGDMDELLWGVVGTVVFEYMLKCNPCAEQTGHYVLENKNLRITMRNMVSKPDGLDEAVALADDWCRKNKIGCQ